MRLSLGTSGATSGGRDPCCSTSRSVAARRLPRRAAAPGHSRRRPASVPAERVGLLPHQAPEAAEPSLPEPRFRSRHTERLYRNRCCNRCCSRQSSRTLNCTRRGDGAGGRLRPGSQQPTKRRWPSVVRQLQTFHSSCSPSVERNERSFRDRNCPRQTLPWAQPLSGTNHSQASTASGRTYHDGADRVFPDHRRTSTGDRCCPCHRISTAPRIDAAIGFHPLTTLSSSCVRQALRNR